jgi:transcription initiation factor IIE alpha subunit
MMFRCPKCGPNCDYYDEHNKVCMLNTQLIEPEESLEVRYSEEYKNMVEGCMEDMP